MKLHWEGRKNTINREVNMLKGKAGQSCNRLLAGRVIWNQAIKQKALCGTEIVCTPKPRIKDMEATQNKVAKWLTHTGQSANATGLRRELEWKTMTSEVAKRKLKWAANVLKMEEDRWPRITLEEMTPSPKEYKWLQEVQQCMTEYSITQGDLEGLTTKDALCSIY